MHWSSSLKKSLPMAMMLFLLSLNQSLLWNMKDAVVVTTAGAEIIPFIKVWVILPSVIFLTMIYAYLSNRISQQNIFYLAVSTFLMFYAIFAFMIYPQHDRLHPVESANYLASLLPTGFKGLISIYRYWTLSAFYVFCELWNTIVISILFWGLANQITKLNEARRTYGVLSLAFNFAIVLAGLMVVLIGTHEPRHWDQTLGQLTMIVIIIGLLTMAIFRWYHLNVIVEDNVEPIFMSENPPITPLTLLESLRYVAQSKALICLAIIVVAYSFTINTVEVIWKDQLRMHYPAASDYHRYLGILQIGQGILAVAISMTIAMLIRLFGWTKTALITPLVMLTTCFFFFCTFLFQDQLEAITVKGLNMTPLALTVFFGAIQNCFSKACKYSLFETTKEMAYLPLSAESRLKGKIAIDGLGVRVGKSGSSLIHQGLLLAFGALSACIVTMCTILLIVLILWMVSVFVLGKSSKACNSIPKTNKLELQLIKDC